MKLIYKTIKCWILKAIKWFNETKELLIAFVKESVIIIVVLVMGMYLLKICNYLHVIKSTISTEMLIATSLGLIALQIALLIPISSTMGELIKKSEDTTVAKELRDKFLRSIKFTIVLCLVATVLLMLFLNKNSDNTLLLVKMYLFSLTAWSTIEFVLSYFKLLETV